MKMLRYLSLESLKVRYSLDDDVIYNRSRKKYQHGTPLYINLYTSNISGHYVPSHWVIGFPYCYYMGDTAEELEKLLEELSRDKNLTTAYCRDLFRLYWYVSRETSGLKLSPFELRTGDILRVDIGSLRICNYKNIGTKKTDSVVTVSEPVEWDLHLIEEEIQTVLEDIVARERTDGNITKIPLTLSGYTKRILQRHAEDFKRLTIKNGNEYHAIKQAYTGGLCAANPGYVGSTLHDVYSYDIDSSYISRMVINKYPMEQVGYYLEADRSIIDTIAGKHLLSVGLYRFTGLKLRDEVSPVGYLSKLHSNITGEVLDGKYIREARTCETYLTSVDFEIVNTLYRFDKVTAYNLTVYRGDYIPNGIIKDMLSVYREKEELKGIESEEYRYKLKKIILSSFYGCMGTSPEIYGGWEEYNTNRKRVGFYPWADFVTAYARRELLNMIILSGDRYIYGNTDSVKCRGDIAEAVEKYNKHQRRTLYNTIIRRGIPWEKYLENLGRFEADGHYKEFKTLGTQKYIYKDYEGNTQAVVSGLKKTIGRNISIDDFTDGFTLSEDESGAYTIKHIEGAEEFDGTDGRHYKINAEYVVEKTTFTLSEGKEGAKNAEKRIQEILQSGQD